MKAIKWVWVTMLCALLRLSISAVAAPAESEVDTNAVLLDMSNAVHRVEAMVNYPVPAYKRTPDMKHVSVYQEGWFHPGAAKPDFNNVDVRKTQETPYINDGYVTSDLNPGFVFDGRTLEFNSMIKYFYTNRTLPKRKLTEAQMVEINRLYRIIGECESKLERVHTAQLKTEVAAETAKDNAATDAADVSTEQVQVVRGVNPTFRDPKNRIILFGTVGLLVALLFLMQLRRVMKK